MTGNDYGDVDVLRGMWDALDEDESRQLVVRDIPHGIGWSLGHSTGESVSDPGSGAWPYTTDVQYDKFVDCYEDLFIDIARGNYEKVNELSDEEWPLFVRVCGRVYAWDVDEEELRAARKE